MSSSESPVFKPSINKHLPLLTILVARWPERCMLTTQPIFYHIISDYDHQYNNIVLRFTTTKKLHVILSPNIQYVLPIPTILSLYYSKCRPYASSSLPRLFLSTNKSLRSRAASDVRVDSGEVTGVNIAICLLSTSISFLANCSS